MTGAHPDQQALFDHLDRTARPVVAVIAPGKTGTSTIAAALKGAGLDPVLQTHLLRDERMAEREATYRRGAPERNPRYLWESQWLCANLPSADRTWSVVTLVRDPTARLVSRFFQEKARTGRVQGRPKVAEVVAELTEFFERDLRGTSPNYDWLDAQLRDVLCVDAYAHPFDSAVGHLSIATDHVDVLLLRSEDLPLAAEPLQSFFGVELPVILAAKNVGQNKAYAGLYGAVLEAFRPPVEFVEAAYSSRMMRHFYTPSEIEARHARWTRPIS